jgi:hypothetical protein
MGQIESFFQLYHLVDWEYVINLSAEHYPLKSTQAIYRILDVFISNVSEHRKLAYSRCLGVKTMADLSIHGCMIIMVN